MSWMDRSVFSFRLKYVSRSYSLIELGRCVGIYTAKETLSPRFYAYLESCITNPPYVYEYMQVSGHARGTYVSRTTK